MRAVAPVRSPIGGNAIADDADVRAKPRRAGAVDDAAAGDQHVEIGRLRSQRDERGHDEKQGRGEQHGQRSASSHPWILPADRALLYPPPHADLVPYPIGQPGRGGLGLAHTAPLTNPMTASRG